MDSVVRVKGLTSGRARSGRDSPDVREVSTESGGSGVVISSDGLILTNEHVVRDADRLTVVLRNGIEYAVEAIATHPSLDLAVVRIDRANLQSIAPAIQTSKVGVAVVAVSCTADRRDHCFRTGVITDTRRSLQRELDPTQRKDYGNLIETTAHVEPGFSGGPLLDSMGQLVGINVAISGRLGTGQQRSYALPLNDRYRQAVAYLAEEVSPK
jgi:S1-C subfamily serine protease